MFGTDSERTLLSLGPDVAVIFVIKMQLWVCPDIARRCTKKQEKTF